MSVEVSGCSLRVPLFPHQRRALAWMQWRERQDVRGGILADEMGLGKTLTMLACVQMQRSAGVDHWSAQRPLSTEERRQGVVEGRGTLVVCPASVLEQWSAEAEKRFRREELTVWKYYDKDKTIDIHSLRDYDIVITTYDTLRANLGVGQQDTAAEGRAQDFVPGEAKPLFTSRCGPVLGLIRWQRVILDESHFIKNRCTQRFRAACQIRAGARWVVTGTPIHNRIDDFFSILHFLRLQPFDQHRIFKSYIEPMKKNPNSRAGKRCEVIVNNLMLRRLKADPDPTTGRMLVELPAKTIEVVELELEKSERLIYDVLLQASQLYVQKFIDEQEGQRDDTFKPRPRNRVEVSGNVFRMGNKQQKDNENERPKTTRAVVFVLLLRLRQACCHMNLLRNGVDMAVLRQECADDVAEVNEAEVDAVLNVRKLTGGDKVDEIFSDTYRSTKVAAVLKAIETILDEDDSSRCVVVSQWTSFLDIIGRQLHAKDILWTSITGQVAPQDRLAVTRRFNDTENGHERVLLLSITAGGVGLNLIGGNHLLLADNHWNPMVELQAFDRIHRIGQTRPVQIKRFITREAMEERVKALQEDKKKLAENVLAGGKATLDHLSLNDLRKLFDLEQR